MVWIKIRKMNPRWCEWAILDQITSVFGTLVDVDWQHNCKSFYETVRVKISCKDVSKIPSERSYGINGKFYKLLIEVERITEQVTEERTDKTTETISQGGQDTSSETRNSSRTDDKRSNISSRSGSGIGNVSHTTGVAAGKQAVLDFLQQMLDVCPVMGVEHPSLLKSHIPTPIHEARERQIEKIVTESISDDQCFSLLTEFELAENDDTCSIDLPQDLTHFDEDQ